MRVPENSKRPLSCRGSITNDGDGDDEIGQSRALITSNDDDGDD